MKRVVKLLVILLLLNACQKAEIEIAPENLLEIKSSYTQQNYELKVVLPDDYDTNQQYPVVYLLDGYYHFEDVGAMFQSESHLQDVILVGIFYKDYPFSLSNLGNIEELREIDLTYPIHQTSGGSEIGGGGLLFYDFLSKELIPTIEATYATDPTNRTLMGHSLSGYFCLFQMLEFRDTPLFKNIVALSPSLWWSNLEIIEMEQAVADESDALPFNLYMGIGGQEGVEANALVDELAEKITAHSHADLNFLKERYEGGHLHSAKTGFDSGLKFIFQ